MQESAFWSYISSVYIVYIWMFSFFDSLLALTTAAREGNYVRPELTYDPIFVIKDGR